ncbi:MAG: hypothetical protein ABH830_05055 [Patescibacteria group bacterium]
MAKKCNKNELNFLKVNKCERSSRFVVDIPKCLEEKTIPEKLNKRSILKQCFEKLVEYDYKNLSNLYKIWVFTKLSYFKFRYVIWKEIRPFLTFSKKEKENINSQYQELLK